MLPIYQKLSWFCKGFLLFQIVFGYDNPTYNTSGVQELPLLTFVGFTFLHSLVLEKQCKGTCGSIVLSMRSDNLTYSTSPSNS